MLRDNWICNIRWDCHDKLEIVRRNQYFPEDQIHRRETTVNDCRFCTPAGSQNANHVPLLCGKLEYIQKILEEILNNPSMIRLLSKHPNAKDKLKLIVVSGKSKQYYWGKEQNPNSFFSSNPIHGRLGFLCKEKCLQRKKHELAGRNLDCLCDVANG